MIEEEKKEAAKNLMIASAFTAWQSGAGEKNMTFMKYLRRFGLAEPEVALSCKQRKRLAAIGFSRAAQINAMDRGRRK